MSAHTPGPWHMGMMPGPMIYGPRGEQVADCSADLLDRAEWIANVRLISAAPDMLGALRLMERQISALYPTASTLDYARAAIAKATGA